MGVRDYKEAKSVVSNMKKTIESLAKELARPVTRLSRSGAKSTHAAGSVATILSSAGISDLAYSWTQENGQSVLVVHPKYKSKVVQAIKSAGGMMPTIRERVTPEWAKSTHAADSLRALAVKLGYAPDAVTVEDGRGTIRFARNDGSAGRLAFSLRKPLAGVIASDRISVADDAVCIDMRGDA
jgi:hypothetical protein